MNIGVYLLNAPEEIGGGFTFEQEVLEGIIEERGASRHTFTAFSTAAALPARYGADIQHFSLTAPQEPTSLSLVDKVRRRLQPAERLDAEKIARESGIDILLNLVPWSTLTLDIPFITIVWDLMHRSHSYFPRRDHHHRYASRPPGSGALLRIAGGPVSPVAAPNPAFRASLPSGERTRSSGRAGNQRTVPVLPGGILAAQKSHQSAVGAGRSARPARQPPFAGSGRG